MQHAAIVHLVPEVVALTAALADAGEDGIAAVLGRDIVDELLNEHRLADASAAEQTDLAALRIGFQKVNDLDPGFQQLRRRALVGKGRGLAVNFPLRRIVRQRTLAVDRLAQYIEHPAKRRLADRNLNAGASRLDRHAARKLLARAQQHTAHACRGELLHDLHHAHFAVYRDMQRLAYGGQLPLFKAAVHDRAGNGQDIACVHSVCASLAFRRCAAAPAVISVISCVISACRRRW